MSIDMNHTRHAPGQAVKPCPQCGGALVDTSDGVWAHAIGVEPCGWTGHRYTPADRRNPSSGACVCGVAWRDHE